MRVNVQMQKAIGKRQRSGEVSRDGNSLDGMRADMRRQGPNRLGNTGTVCL